MGGAVQGETQRNVENVTKISKILTKSRFSASETEPAGYGFQRLTQLQIRFPSGFSTLTSLIL